MADAVLAEGPGLAPARPSFNPLKAVSIGVPFGYTAAFFVVPLAFFVLLGFWRVENFQVVPALSLDNYADIAGHILSGSNYGIAIVQSLYVSVTTALCAVLFCYPLVLAIVYAVPARHQRLVLLFAVAPFWTSYILRVFAWQILLARRGIVNSAAAGLGWEGWQQGWLNTQVATRIGLVHYLAPVLVIILYVTVSSIDRTLIEAARELGASRLQAFRRVILPLSRVGLVVSLSFATIISFGDVLSGSLLGGGAGRSVVGAVPLFSNMIMGDYASSTNLPRTCALAMILVLILVGILMVGLKATERAQRAVA